MKNKNYLYLKSIIEQYHNNRHCYINSDCDSVEKLFNGFIEIKLDAVNLFNTNCYNFIEDFIEEKRKINETNKKTSHLFNSLRFFNINETQHSFLIANLLDPNAEHGQGDLFLKKFLVEIGIEVFENDKWIVTTETGKVDILLKRKKPHSVVIIENKSNGAVDQNNQLYRYWLQQMYFPTKEREYRYTLDNRKNYRLVYLSPNEKKPEENSLLKPNWDWLVNYPYLPEKLEMNDILILSFNKKIVKWLENCLQYLDENYRLREYVKQYIELWKF